MLEVEELSLGKCRELLGGGVFGRVGVCTPEGPVILPVNYSLVSERIVFRTGRDGLLARHVEEGRVAFEVDHVDYVEHRGWSVVVQGRAEIVTDPEVARHVERTWAPRPWAAGERPLLVRIEWDQMSGRRLGTGWTYAEELPVRRQV